MKNFILNYKLRLLGAKVGIECDEKIYVYILRNIHLAIPN
jgi:hypothetical protein